MVKLVTKKASSEARQRADKIIRDVHKKLGKEYKFFCRPIGSQTRRCIVQDKNGKYDLDYQIVLTQNSKGDLNPTSIKKRFLWAFTSVRNKNEKVEDSTTVITVPSKIIINKDLTVHANNLGHKRYPRLFHSVKTYFFRSCDGEQPFLLFRKVHYTYFEVPLFYILHHT